MKRMVFAAALAAFCLANPLKAQEAALPDTGRQANWSIAIHGGAGTIVRDRLTEERRVQYEQALQIALDAGSEVLSQGGSAVEAVKAAVVLLEDNPLFNAGRGSVYTWDATIEMDASIMDGRDRSAGAVASVDTIRNPILLADEVRTQSEHVFLAGDGAEQFAQARGIETAPADYFETEGRRESLERLKAEKTSSIEVDYKFGTVGAVALDQNGDLAAATSTGGMTGKRWGRVGDSPVIGAGTYADNRSCAVSATGWGEYFIRVGVAHEICTRIRLQRYGAGNDTVTSVSVDQAQAIADDVMAEVKNLGGDGGTILVTSNGDALYSFNTAGMYRGRANSDGMNEVAIFGGERQADESNTPDH